MVPLYTHLACFCFVPLQIKHQVSGALFKRPITVLEDYLLPYLHFMNVIKQLTIMTKANDQA